jgi:hypothetical protein
MSTTEMMGRIAEVSHRFKARIAAVIYGLAGLAAGSEFFLRGTLGLALSLIAVASMIALMLVFDHGERTTGKQTSRQSRIQN